MKKIIYNSLAILASAVVATSCFDLTERAYSEILQKDFVPSDQDVVALLASSYAEFGSMMDWYGMYDAQEEVADILVKPARPNGWVDGGIYQRMHEHKWDLTGVGSPETIYNSAFAGINNANRVLDQIKDGSLPAGELKDYIMDELKAIRAVWYAVLLDSYGNVPIVTSFFNTEDLPKQSSRRRVYEFVTKQLTEVIDNGVLSTINDGAYYGRLNMWGVKMALMRVYLNAEVYVGTPEWQKALDLAEDIIANSPYSLCASYKDNFKCDNGPATPEIIFAIPYSNIYDTGGHVFCKGMEFYPPSEGRVHFNYKFNTWGGSCANPQFVNSYQEGDTRKTDTWLYGPQYCYDKPDSIAWWCMNYLPSMTCEQGTSNLTSIDWGCRQFKYEPDTETAYGTQWNNDFPWFRLAEAYYTAAECILRGATSGKGNTPADLVNQVRQRSAPAITVADLTRTQSCYKYGLASFGGVTSDDLNIYGKGMRKDAEGKWELDPNRMPHDWTGRAEALEASQTIQASGADNDPIQFAGMYDEWGWEFALEGLRRQVMIRFGTFGTRNWFNHKAIGDNHTALFPFGTGIQNDNENIGQNPGYEGVKNRMASDLAIDDPIPANM